MAVMTREQEKNPWLAAEARFDQAAGPFQDMSTPKARSCCSPNASSLECADTC